MKIALEQETTLQLLENHIEESDKLFSEDKESSDEPIFADLKKCSGLSKDELERIAPQIRLENLLNPKEYKAWKHLPLPEKQRTVRRLRASKEYKEYLAALATLKQPIKTPDKINVGAGSVASLGGMQPVIQTQMQKEKKATPVITVAKKAAKKLAKNASEATKDFSNGQNSGNTMDRAEKFLKKTIRAKVSTGITMLMGAVTYVGLPIALLALSVFLIFFLLVCFLFTQQNPSENAGIMPYYAQADYPSTSFNGATIASDGCGITSMAMVVSLFKNETITPPDLATLANADAGYNTVQSHGAINKFAAYYELGDVEEMAGPEKNCCEKQAFDLSYLQDKLQTGSPVIVSVTGGYYNPAGGGHYIALYGVGTNGVFVYDPGSRAKYTASINSDGVSLGFVTEKAKHIWIFPAYEGTYLEGNTNEETVFLSLTQAGFSKAAAAGVIGNMYQECAHGATDLKPESESKDGSIGLLQWTDGRRKNLENLAFNRGTKWSELPVQIEYLLQELNSLSQWEWTKYAASHYPAADNLSFEEFKQLSDPQLAAEVFQAKFVRPKYESSNLSYRKMKAQEVYSKYRNP